MADFVARCVQCHYQLRAIGDGSVPDTSIQNSTALWFETKTVPNSIDLEQIRSYLSGLRQEASDTQRLVVLTPDHSRPKKLDRIEDDRLVWTNFDQLVYAAESILARDHGSAEQSLEIPTVREAFLLRELVRFLYEEDLVVVARIASSSLPLAKPGPSTTPMACTSANRIARSSLPTISPSTPTVRSNQPSQRSPVQSRASN